MKFGPKTTTAINTALPRFNGVLAKPVPTTGGSIAIKVLFVLLGLFMVAGSSFAYYTLYRFGA